MIRRIVSEKAPKVIGPYSHASVAGGFLFSAGQIGINPASGKLEDGFERQARQTLENLKSVLSGENLSFADVVKTTIFLANMDDYPLLNKIYSEYFTTDFPSRSAVQVTKLPAGALLEIELVAHLGNE